MGMLRDIALRALIGKAAAQQLSSAQFISGTRSMPPKRGTKEFIIAYRSSPWLRACVSKISESLAANEWQVWAGQGNKKKQLEAHPMLDMLKKGSPEFNMTGYDCMVVTGVHLEVAGEAFWLLERGAGNKPVGYFPMPPHWVIDLPKPNADYYKINVPNGGFNGNVASSEVVYFRNPDPEAPHERGAGLAAALSDELDTDEAAAKHISSYLFNKARPDIIITGTKDSELGTDATNKLESLWTSKLAGPGKAGRPMFFKNDINIKEIGSPLRELELVPLRAHERDMIVSVFGVPPEKMGILSSSNRATIDAADFFMAKDVLVPRLRRMRNVLQLLAEREWDSRLLIEFESPITEDREFQLKVATAMPASRTIDEWRALQDMPEIEGGKGKVYPKAFTYNFEPELENAPAPDYAPADPAAAAPADGSEPKHMAKGSAKSISVDDVVSISDMVDDPQVLARSNALLKALLEQLVLDYGEAAIRDAGSEVAFQINSTMRGFIDKFTGERIKGLVNPTTRDAIRAAISDSIAAGDDLPDIATAIRDVFSEARGYRSRTIAETEVTRAVGFTGNEALSQAGISNKQWLTTLDGNARDTHAAMDGQIAPTEGSFKSPTGAMAPFPGGFGDPAEDINCRCAVEAALNEKAGESAEQRRARWLAKDARRKPFDKQMERLMRRVFSWQEEAVLAELAKRGGV